MNVQALPATMTRVSSDHLQTLHDAAHSLWRLTRRWQRLYLDNGQPVHPSSCDFFDVLMDANLFLGRAVSDLNLLR